MGLIGRGSRRPLPLRLQGAPAAAAGTLVLRLTRPEQTHTFVDVAEEPVPSLLRGFSAPVRLHVPGRPLGDLLFLMRHDTDAFARWEAGQEVATALLFAQIRGEAPSLAGLTEALRAVLVDPALDEAFKGLMLTLPSEAVLATRSRAGTADVDAIKRHRDAVLGAAVDALRPELWRAYRACTAAPEGREGAGRRALRNCALQLLCHGAGRDPAALDAACAQFRDSANMTERIGALEAVVRSCPVDAPGAPAARRRCLDAFYAEWKGHPVVVLKWLSLSARSPDTDPAGLARLMAHEAFDFRNPNKVNAVVRGFASVPHALPPARRGGVPGGRGRDSAAGQREPERGGRARRTVRPVEAVRAGGAPGGHAGADRRAAGDARTERRHVRDPQQSRRLMP